MKKSLFTLSIILISTWSSFAQTKVKANDIINLINDGKNVTYSNAEIEGVLDFTDLKNRSRQRSYSSWYSDNDTYESSVEVSVSFINCTFTDDVLAYYHLQRSEDTYIANFERDVIFKNCTFKRASEFKYSEFDGIVDFTGTTFVRSANFKYAEFSSGPSFAEAKFEEGADFKYTEFPRETSFKRATFYGLSNFKYTKFRSPVNLENVGFKGHEDFKYTKIDGRSFTSYLLENR
jgi:hypothetical protein